MNNERERMKVLWIVNNPMACLRKDLNISRLYGGGWLDGLLECIKDENRIQLFVATPMECEQVREIDKEGVKFYLVPGGAKSKVGYNKKFDYYWDIVINKIVKPDIIHIHGTEFSHQINVIKVSKQIKKIASIQGFLNEYKKYFFYGLSEKEVRSNITFKDIIRRTSIKDKYSLMDKQSKNEMTVLDNVDYIFGRTLWDKAHIWEHNFETKYIYAGEILRSGFYSSRKWNYNECNKNTIFISQATYPIKGMHILIDALAILKKKGIDFCVNCAGSDIFNGTFKDNIKDDNYTRLIKKRIRKANLESNIHMLGVLDEQGMIANLIATNLYVCTSCIENSPNSLGEAMYLGVPSIVSYVGGVPSMIDNNIALFDLADPTMLAYKMYEVLSNKSMQLEMSLKEIELAEERFDKEIITQQILEAYEKIYIQHKVETD